MIFPVAALSAPQEELHRRLDTNPPGCLTSAPTSAAGTGTYCDQLNEHAPLRKLSKVAQCEKPCVTHPGH